ncbi:MAG: hypothetical protein RRC34_05815 [Lentisphaeria bacterium]|nr:hypothetical protein [Lentisphaeria bacterium]
MNIACFFLFLSVCVIPELRAANPPPAPAVATGSPSSAGRLAGEAAAVSRDRLNPPTVPSASGEAVFLNDLTIRLYGESTHVNQVRVLLGHCARELDKRLPNLAARKTRWLSIFILNPGTKPPALPPLGETIIIPVNSSADMIVFSCARGLLRQRLAAPDKTLRSFDWIAAAVTFDLSRARDSRGGTSPDYRVIETALDQGDPPTPGDLAEFSISPEWPHAFIVFATWSHAFYSLLDQTPAGNMSALVRFTHHLDKGVPPKEAWDKTWLSHAVNNQAATQWLSETTRVLINRYSTRQHDVTSLMDDVNEILGVAVLIPGPDGKMGYRKIAITRLRAQFPDIRLDTETLNTKEEKIFALLKRVPLSLQWPLANYMGALQERKQGLSWEKFLLRLENAENDLEAALKRYRGVLSLLDDMAPHYGASDSALLPALQVSAEHAARTRSLAPGITRFLDRFSAGGAPAASP